MHSLFEQTKKIIKQLFGKEKMFGYETVLANQLFLLYGFSGKIYFTEKINFSFRIIWILYHLSGLFVGYVVAVAFLLHDEEPDILMQLFMINMIANSTLMGFFMPFITFLYRDSIERSIRDIDSILRVESGNAKLDLWTFVLRNIVIEIIAGAIFAYICVLNVIIFYEEAKVKNYAYYLFPFPNTEQVGTFRMFVMSTALSCVILSSQSIEALSAMTFILIWNVVCHSQLKITRQKLDERSALLSLYIKKHRYNHNSLPRSIENVFRQSVVRGVRDFQRITRLIELLRRFYQLFCSTAVPVTIVGVIVQLHSIVSTDLPWIVKIKGVGMMTAVAYPLLLFCWIGETLENSISEVSFSVYSMPWYWSARFRQDTHLFLCQTQNNLNFTAIRVYPMLLRTFSRFSHFVLSSVNFLHQLSRRSIQVF